MYDQSFNEITLARALRKSDFVAHPRLKNDAYRQSQIKSAVATAIRTYSGRTPLIKFHLNGKWIYRFRYLKDELVARHLCANLKRVVRIRPQSREFVIANLAHLLSEGVPYRVYRLDIRNFYESFHVQDVTEALSAIPGLGPLSKDLINGLLTRHGKSATTGLPRGLALSAFVSEFMMLNFDTAMRTWPGVYFYGRYVDDMVVITNGEENVTRFLNQVCSLFPKHLALHETKKRVLSAPIRVDPQKALKALFAFDYLGYRFTVSEPMQDSKVNPRKQFRHVDIDIAPSKIKRLKTRIVRSLIDFSKTKNFRLLISRIKFLSTNFSIYDFENDRKKLSGIYHSYPQLSSSSAQGLVQLDSFLHNAVLSKKGRLFCITSSLLTGAQKRMLLKQSFIRGHSRRVFVHFSPKLITEVQRGWAYE